MYIYIKQHICNICNTFLTMLAYKAGLSILSGTIQSINAKCDDFQSFVTRVTLLILSVLNVCRSVG